VNCLDCFASVVGTYERLLCVIGDARTKEFKRAIKSTHSYALLRVSAVNTIRSEAGTKLIVRHDPERGDASHCGIFGLEELEKGEQMTLQQQIADLSEGLISVGAAGY
jgi:hypothetical protein